MEEKNITKTDEQLAQELRKSKGGKLGGPKSASMDFPKRLA